MGVKFWLEKSCPCTKNDKYEVCPEATEAAEDHFKPYFKISPETAKDAEFQDRVQQQAAKQISRERAKEKRATLTFLMLVQSHLSKKASKGNLSLLPKLKSIQLRIHLQLV